MPRLSPPAPARQATCPAVAAGPLKRGRAGPKMHDGHHPRTLPPRGEPDGLLNLSLQNAAAAGGARITTLKGGVPIVVDGQVIGAVGVGGGTGEQDAEVARAGIQALLDRLGDKDK